MSLERLRVAVVRGGNTPSFEASLASGEAVLRVLRESEARYAPLDIFVDRAGVWHLRGLPSDPAAALKHIDLVWDASGASLQGERLEQTLERMKIPYIGSGAVSKALAQSTKLSRDIYSRAKLPTIRYVILNREKYSDDDARRIFRNFLHPVSVRAAGGGFGSWIAHGYHELEAAIRGAFEQAEEIVVEEFQKGKEAIVSVIENARGEKRYTLLPSERREGRHVAPGNFSPEEKRRLAEMARTAYEALGLRQYSASSFLVTPKHIYIIETSALPELHGGGHLAKALAATGWKEKEFVGHLIDLTIKS